MNRTLIPILTLTLCTLCTLAACEDPAALQPPTPNKTPAANQSNSTPTDTKAATTEKPSPTNNTTPQIIINAKPLTQPQITALEKQYNVKLAPGRYWYDRKSGAWGLEGFPVLGLAPAGLDLGGDLSPNASSGNTGVFLNGRELHALEVAALANITPVQKGRFWMDAQGFVGFEGGPPVMNLYQLAAQQQTKKKNNYWSSYTKGVGTVGNDGEGYFFSGENGTTWYSGM